MANPTLVYVPGFAGSELATPRSLFGLGPPIPVWLSYPTLIAGGWRWLELAADGITPVTPLTGPLTPGRPLADYYGAGIEQWEGLGWRVYSPHLEWRGTLQADGQRLADLIAILNDEGPVMIVAHSRGGLVTRWALQILQNMGIPEAVERVCCLGTPHYGSLSAMALLAGWDEWAALLRRLVFGIESVFVPPALQRDLQRAINSWPSIYELLPNPSAVGWGAYIPALLYDPTAWENAGVQISQAWLMAGHDAWSTLPPAGQNYDWLDVCGWRIPTPYQLVAPQIPVDPTGCRTSHDGDGTVLVWSAFSGAGLQLISPTSHRALAHDGRVVRAVDAWLRTGRLATNAITGPVLN